MIILSFKARQVGGTCKMLSLKRIIRNLNMDIILIQETMVGGGHAKVVFEYWIKIRRSIFWM